MPDSLPQPEKRKPLTRVQFATLILKQEGRCGCGCRAKLIADQIIDEHLVALDFLGSNSLENRSLWTRDCSKAKTAGDLAASAKGKRIRGETGNGPKRKIVSRGFAARPDDAGTKLLSHSQAVCEKSKTKSQIKPRSQIQSRPFDKTKTRTFAGKVRERVK